MPLIKSKELTLSRMYTVPTCLKHPKVTCPLIFFPRAECNVLKFTFSYYVITDVTLVPKIVDN